MEHVARHALDDAVDTAIPHAFRVDGGHERVGLDLRDVAFDEVDGQVADPERTLLHGSSFAKTSFKATNYPFGTLAIGIYW